MSATVSSATPKTDDIAHFTKVDSTLDPNFFVHFVDAANERSQPGGIT
jgi:hypothetical protein